MKVSCLLALLFLLTTTVMAQQDKESYFLFVGTYTNDQGTNGIHVYSFDASTGNFSERSKYTDIRNPSFLALSADGENVYAVSEAGEGQGINAFSFDRKTATLRLLNRGTSGGSGPCYVSVDRARRGVFTGNYGAGSLAVTRLEADGSLTNQVQVIQHQGRSVNERRQEKPHVHAVVLTPDEKFLLVPDLGIDKIGVYRYDPEAPQPLSHAAVPFVEVKAGAGPRHLAFHPNGKFLYAVMELEGLVVAYDYRNGTLKEKQIVPMVSSDFEGRIGAADIHVSPDGKFLYASNRGDANDIVIYAISADGLLRQVGRQREGIDTPRNFAIDPTGTFLLVGNQGANNISIFRRNKQTGSLEDTGKRISVDKPVCLKFLR